MHLLYGFGVEVQESCSCGQGLWMGVRAGLSVLTCEHPSCSAPGTSPVVVSEHLLLGVPTLVGCRWEGAGVCVGTGAERLCSAPCSRLRGDKHLLGPSVWIQEFCLHRLTFLL